ncbi:fumarylacetoacetate hydrolase [Caenimonas sedimenti]|uniref:Fumarylacetoacetate hydrolase n=1 Tax=Caenimonas sedimenti TaxID=2596921 RepID=A0A562ZIW0_9BURK|nr:fumarylacetoacetate hydrolase [Caenimonas sedimenti]TWO68519.1 fumarylacetoacetate hydrolase [Caenimonas sedimenti]
MRTHVVLAALLCAATARAECLGDAQVANLAASYTARAPAPDLAVMSEEDASCSRAKLAAVLAVRLGAPIGYKVGLTNEAIRRMVKGTGPAWGTLYGGDFVPSGAKVSVKFAARPTVEADLLVRVRSSDIQRATTPQQVLAALDQVIPFIELPDMLVANPNKLDARGMTAINMAARGGITGTSIAIPEDSAGQGIFFDALGQMKVQVADGSGRRMGTGTGADLLGHPMASALWLVQALAKAGIVLKAGDLLSLGSFPPVVVPSPGLVLRVTYEGLTGAQPVWVEFTD